MPLNDLMAAVSTQVLAAADRDTALRAADDATALKLLLDHPQPASP